MKYIIHTDGGARGNPGPAAIGVVIKNELGQSVVEFGKPIGETTNNVAEYRAVIEALEHLKSRQASSIDFFLDSRLVVSQINGEFKVKDAKLRELLFKVRSLEQETGKVIRYQLISREKNRRADYLVNRALDNLMSSSLRSE